MSKKDFEHLLSKHESKEKEDPINWEQQKQEWLSFINQFYTYLETWFEPYKTNGKLSYEYRPYSLTEENIGTYETRTMYVKFAGQDLKIEPIGTLLIGTKGRIDLEGARGRIQFILADRQSKEPNIRVSIGEPIKNDNPKKIDWTWKIALRDARKIAYEEFNEDNFFDALMEVVNV